MKIKICGMRDTDNITSVSQLKPDFMGFIFFSKSPRNAINISSDSINSIKKEITPVAVFVNEDLSTVKKIIDTYQFTTVQLHGNESVDYCEELKKAGINIFKVFSIDENTDFESMAAFEGVSDYSLFDTKSPKHGGTGLKFDWNLLDNYKGQTPVILSGGISPDDVIAIQNAAKKFPFVKGIDLNSKFESAPGIKDLEKLSYFLKAFKN